MKNWKFLWLVFTFNLFLRVVIVDGQIVNFSLGRNFAIFPTSANPENLLVLQHITPSFVLPVLKLEISLISKIEITNKTLLK